MKETTKQERHNKRLAQLLGMNPEDVQALRSKEDADDKVREAQAILLFVERPEAFISKKCDECHGQFLTTYQFVSVCSTLCRLKSLERIGVEWNPLHTPEERWKRSKIPTEYSIPPRALRILLQLAEKQQQLQGFDELISEPPEPTPNIPPSYNDVQESPPAKLLASADVEAEELLKEFGLDLTL